jgi:BlaI family transcriptional regulator, penicillinase repressor
MARRSLPTLTRAESEIMGVVWDRGAVTVHEVVESMTRPVAYTTVLTILRILEKKGYVKHDPDPQGGRAYVYSPAVPQDEVRREHVRDLVQRMFSGNFGELAAGLVEEEKLSRKELEELRTMIETRLGKKEKKR